LSSTDIGVPFQRRPLTDTARIGGPATPVVTVNGTWLPLPAGICAYLLTG
jgi:hypothetical protein